MNNTNETESTREFVNYLSQLPYQMKEDSLLISKKKILFKVYPPNEAQGTAEIQIVASPEDVKVWRLLEKWHETYQANHQMACNFHDEWMKEVTEHWKTTAELIKLRHLLGEANKEIEELKSQIEVE